MEFYESISPSRRRDIHKYIYISIYLSAAAAASATRLKVLVGMKEAKSKRRNETTTSLLFAPATVDYYRHLAVGLQRIVSHSMYGSLVTTLSVPRTHKVLGKWATH